MKNRNIVLILVFLVMGFAGRVDAGSMVSAYSSEQSYVSPDMPVIFNISCKVQGSISEQIKYSFKFIFEVPPGIAIEGADYQGYGKINMEEEKISIDGESYIRYSAPVGEIRNYVGWVQLYLTTTLKEGEERKAYFYLTWSGGQQKKQVVKFTSIRIPEATTPKKIIAGMTIYHYAWKTWPNFIENYKRLGMNTIAYPDPAIYSSEPDELLDKFIKECVDQGLWVSGGWFPLESVEGHPEAQAVNLVGTKLKKPCPSYRGPLFQKWVEKAVNVPRHGISWLNYDDEVYSDGMQICFCERCKERFKAFLKEKYPSFTYVDPVKFEQEFSTYPELDKAWIDFKTEMVTEWFRIIREKVTPEIIKYKAKSGPKPGLTMSDYLMQRKVRQYHLESHLHDLRKLAGPLDFMAPMAYTGCGNKTPAWAGSIVEFFVKEIGSQDCKALAGLDAQDTWGGPGGSSWKPGCLPNEYVRDDILETLMAGGKGFIICKWIGLDGLDFKYLAETMNIISGVEDIIMDGKSVEVKVVKSDKRVLVKAREYKDKTLVLVSEYLKNEPIEVTLQYPGKSPKKVIDLYTNEVISELSQKNNTFAITLDKDRARLFLIKRRR